MCTRVLICSTEFAPTTKVEQIRTRVLICTRVHFHKHRLYDQNTPQVQIYTLGVYLHRSVYCAYKRGLRLPFRSVGSGWQWISEGLNCVRFLFKFVTWKIGPLSHLNNFHVFPRDNTRKPLTLCKTQSLNIQIHFHLLYWLVSLYI